MRNIVMLIFCCLISATGTSQTPSAVKDTVYVFILRGRLENERPIVSYTVVKDLSQLSGLTSITSQDEFICEFFKHSILFEEPFFTLCRNKKLSNFTTENERKSFLKKLTKKITRANKNYQDIQSRSFSNGKSIELSCIKLCGEFWSIPKTKDALNSYNHSFEVKKNCYDKGYTYNLKDIDQSCRISKEEMETIQK